jgi:SAM-dependent methyltransferase
VKSMKSIREAGRTRAYPGQTYASPYWFIRIPHQMRYRAAMNAIRAPVPPTVLDYGAGDGKLLIDLIEAGIQTESIVAYEPVEEYRSMLHAALAERGVADRVTVVQDRHVLDDGSFDVITCLGVLEHMPLPERQAFYDVCASSLRPGGRIFIDVPIEVGPSLLVKSLTRVFLKGREPEYDIRTLVRLAFGGTAYDPGRFDPSDTRTWILNHKGFDYRLFRRELANRFEITEEQRTPLPWLPAALGNQEIYFHASRR